MKRFLTLVAAAVMICGCAGRSIPEKMDALADKVELHGDSYTDEQWEEMSEFFEDLVEQYLESPESFSKAEKKMAASAIGRFHAAALKNGISEAAGVIDEFVGLLPDYIKGFSKELENGAEDFANSLNSLFQDKDGELEKSLEDLGSALEGLFGNLDD